MRWRIQVFGPLARAAESNELSVGTASAPASVTLAELRKQIASEAPALAPLLPACRFAVNHEFVEETRQVVPGDEIALIGLVSGG